MLAENLRMLYVSVTRARERCYLAWGRINTAETSALAYLLRSGMEAEDHAVDSDWVSRLRAEFNVIGDDEVRNRLDEVAAASDGTIVIRPLPEQPATRGPQSGRPSGSFPAANSMAASTPPGR